MFCIFQASSIINSTSTSTVAQLSASVGMDVELGNNKLVAKN